MIPTIVYVLVVAHFVADFVAQSDWMATNKSKRWDALAWHVSIYMLMVTGVLTFAGAMIPLPTPALRDVGLARFIAGNAAAHFVQDAITSRINARLWFFKFMPGRWVRPQYEATDELLTGVYVPGVGDRHWFFVAIGFDQLLHYVTLFVTASWWLQ